MNKKSKTKNSRKKHLKLILFTNIIALLLVTPSLSLAFPIGSGVRFHTSSGYFTFTNLITVGSTIYMNGGWNLTNIHLTGDDEALSYAWITVSAGHLQISHLIYKKRFEATITAPSGTIVTIQLKLSKWTTTTPKSVKINNQYYKAMSRSMQEFNNAQYTTWYWKSGILYLKVKTSSTIPIVIDWAETPPSPAPPSPPAPPTPPTPTPPALPQNILETIQATITQLIQCITTLTLTEWVIILIAIIIIIIILKSRD